MLKRLGLSSIALLTSINAHAFTLIENVTVTDHKITIPINGYSDPVIFSSVPTFNDQDAGVISISNVTDTSFDVQFMEWPYLDGAHGDEQVSFLVAEKGRHTLNDGSIWEVGEFAITGGAAHQFFQESFAHTPHVILSGQTQNDPDAYALRVSSTSALTFGATLTEQESGNNHSEETIGYLAVYNNSNAGLTDTGEAYNLTQQAVNQQGFQTINGKLVVQEEQSKDSETSHLLEVINLLSIKNQLFAQDITHYGKDTMALRLDTGSEFAIDPGEATGQHGNIALIGTNGLTESSYTASQSYGLDSAAGAFDGYNSSSKINLDAGAKIKRGIWLSTYAQDHWLQVAFERQAYITSFRVFLYSGASDPGMGVKNVTLQVSQDNINYVDHESFSLAKSLDQLVTLTEPAIGKYIRLKITSTQGHSYRAIGELEYYGGFVSHDPVTPPEEPTPTTGTTCATIKQQNPDATTGLYQIDPDGNEGTPAFYAHCEMTLNGGGWTLVAHHQDGLDTIFETTPVTQASTGALPAQQWQAVQQGMTTGMMFVDEYARVAQISKSKLTNGNCVAVQHTADLTQPQVPYDIGVLWQQEGTGCSLSGLDYSFISLSTKSTSRGDGYQRAGASLYQHNVKFDLWPYNSGVYSGAEQNTLLYYVK
ncbi:MULTISPECIES: fibrinogen-like YCDxxxxGGGW domain-containing protein [unclassified Pseudoalteromonas]|uniref:fibrinogen-like YCDxxxxGGGW domain-containing protein n=1 Tax=unclassified Pseudoalteromonas TaxID=194690 RepID=UPI002097ECBE|nr:fibrinogen-like YCDxxxxGGGW domain-containing protein [Pseudoalteromonas sp. XMcav2-N]MCO7188924.1 fibrinogen-like YCDxxxxGGGW domain-containing protein [Pseudoalteromonas sp. XMcav2-N]